jgi:hypothetical protein
MNKSLSAKAGRFFLRLKVIYFEPQNRRTAEQGTAEYRSEEYCLMKLLLFEIPYSIFDIQNEKHAKAIRLKGEGSKPGEWKNKKVLK